jgi:phosphohistidine phosphatase
MLRLYILRHAKAVIATPGMKDFERPLAVRGETDCLHLAKAMADKDYLPEMILCSPARRTTMTLEGVMPAWRKLPKPRVAYDEALYSGDHRHYLSAVRSLPAGTKAAMIVGHNPNCEMVSSQLCGGGLPEAVRMLRQKFPTAALAVFDLDIAGWNEADTANGSLVDFLVPKEL